MELTHLSPTVIAPLAFPVDPNDRLDLDALMRNVDRWNATPLAGYVIGSAGGEERYFGQADILAAIRTVAAAKVAGRLVVGGIDNPGTSESIRMAHTMAEAGADLVRVRVPQSPTGGSRGNVEEYFRAITTESPVPVIIIHQTWQTGGHAASPEEIGAICAMDNVAAYICWQDMRYESFVRLHIPAEVPFWTPNASLLVPGAAIGATGACCFFAAWAPQLVIDVLTDALAGRWEKARERQRRILHADFLGMQYGARALKAGLSLLGYEGTIPRQPVPPLTSAEITELTAAFRTAGLLPEPRD